MTKRRVSPAGAAATVAAATVVIAGLVVLGTPSHARERKLDALRTDDLATISAAVDQYWNKHSALPDSLDSLVSTHELDRLPKDPQTDSRYTYLASGARSYRLCATFQQPSDTLENTTRNTNVVFSNGGRTIFVPVNRTWRHSKGESCFDLTPPEKESK